MADTDVGQDGDPSRPREEELGASPATSANGAPTPDEHLTTSMPQGTGDTTPKSPARASAISEADLAGRRQIMVMALASPGLLPDQRASLQAALDQFRSVEAKMLDAIVCLAKFMEVQIFYVFPPYLNQASQYTQ